MNNANAILAAAREELNALILIPMSVVVDTQYLENYGAHAWDGEGECPQRWKFKGGSVYVIDAGLRYADDPMNESKAQALYMEHLDAIEHRDDYSEEYVIGARLVPTSELAQHHRFWDNPVHVPIENAGT